MNIVKKVGVAALIIIALFLAYRLLFVRTVYYEIGGIKIPSKYNALTGKVRPILNYKGRPIKKVIEDRNTKNFGLSEEQVTLAQFRWAVFEQWATLRPEYKDWNTDPDIFKKANIAFQKAMDASGAKAKIIR